MAALIKTPKRCIGLSRTGKGHIHIVNVFEGTKPDHQSNRALCDSRMHNLVIDHEANIGDVTCPKCKKHSIYKEMIETEKSKKPAVDNPLPTTKKTKNKKTKPKKTTTSTTTTTTTSTTTTTTAPPKKEKAKPEPKEAREPYASATAPNYDKAERLSVKERIEKWQQQTLQPWLFCMSEKTLKAYIIHMPTGLVFFDNLSPGVAALAVLYLNKDLLDKWDDCTVEPPKDFVTNARDKMRCAYTTLGLNPPSIFKEEAPLSPVKRLRRRRKPVEASYSESTKQLVRRDKKQAEKAAKELREKKIFRSKSLSKIRRQGTPGHSFLVTIGTRPTTMKNAIQKLMAEFNISSEKALSVIKVSIKKAVRSGLVGIHVTYGNEPLEDIYKLTTK